MIIYRFLREYSWRYFIDITSKVAILRNNYLVNPEWKGPLIPFIKKEMENKLDVLNSENNKKYTNDPKYLKYESSIHLFYLQCDLNWIRCSNYGEIALVYGVFVCIAR